MKREETQSSARLPEDFRPIMWSYVFEEIDLDAHKDDIILNTINHGNLDHWRWIINYYGKDVIQAVLKKRLVTEFNKESRNLAQLIFSVDDFRHAR